MDFLGSHLEDDPAEMPSLSYHVALEDRETTLRKSARLAELDHPQPFQSSRTRAYEARVEKLAEPQLRASNAAVMSSVSTLRTSPQPGHPQEAHGKGSSAQMLQLPAPQGLTLPPVTAPPGSAGIMQGGLTRDTSLSGGRPASSTSPSLPAPQHPTGSLMSLGNSPAPTAQRADPQLALGEIQSLQQEIMQLEGTLSELKGSQVLSTLGRPVKPPRNMVALRESKQMQQGGGGFKQFPLHASFPELVNKQGHAPSNKPTRLPPTRKEAELLAKLVEETLPPGMVTMKVQQSMFDVESADGVNLVDLTMLEHDFSLIDSVQHAAAEQVSGSCAERGRVVDTIRQRYGEFFLVLSRLLYRLQEAYLQKCHELKDSDDRLGNQQEVSRALEVSLQETDLKLQQSLAELGETQKEFQSYRDESKEMLTTMQSDKRTLEATVSHYEARLQKAEVQRAEALTEATSVLEDEISRLIDERDDLMQRIRFLERQLAKAQEGMANEVPLEHQATQTDEGEWAATSTKAGAGEGGDHAEQSEAGMDGEDMVGDSMQAQTKKKKGRRKKRAVSAKKRKNLGGFSEFVTMDKVGRIKSKSWVIKCIAQIYSDKAVADDTDDRENNDRQKICEYVYDWHLNKYGLRNLAEVNLVDLIVSCRHYARINMKIRLFSHFTGLVDSASPFRDSMEHINFYLLCLTQLAAPQPVVSLFPDTEDGIAWLKPVKVLIAIKNIFRLLNDPDKHKDFMTLKVEPLQNSKTGLIDADVLLLILLEEWSRRLEMNAAHLKALFRAGDSDDDGLVTYDEFVALVKLIDPEIADPKVIKIYRHALETASEEMVDSESFVTAMQRHGLSRWRITWGEVSGAERPAPSTNDDMFEILDSVLETTDPSLEEQLRIVRDKINDESTILNMEKHYRSFMTKYSSRVDPEGAWLAYRLLVGKIASVLSMYRLGKSRPESPTAAAVRDIANKLLKEDVEATAGMMSVDAVRARSPLHGSRTEAPNQRSINTSNSPSRPLSRESPELVPERSVDRLIVSVGAAAADAMGGPSAVIQKKPGSSQGPTMKKLSLSARSSNT